MANKHFKVVLGRRTDSFTIVELLISFVIIAGVSLAIYSVFSGGIIIWRRSIDFRDYQRDPRVVLETIARELRNTFSFSQMPFEGRADRVAFSGLIESENFLETESFKVGRIIYWLDAQGVFWRQEKNYGEALLSLSPGLARELLFDVKNLNFSYLVFDPELKQHRWVDSWPQPLDQESQGSEENKTEDKSVQDIPDAVKINLELKIKGRDSSEISKTILIPSGPASAGKR